MAFNVKRYLIKVRGGQVYLPVSARLIWFREEHPDWSIETTPLQIDTENRLAVFQATVKDESGRVIATGTKMETGNDFFDYLEKAETGSIGRALAVCGFGTQFAPELTAGEVPAGGHQVYIVDAPVSRDGEEAVAEAPDQMVCEECGAQLKKAQYDLSIGKFKRPLCPNCQRKIAASAS